MPCGHESRVAPAPIATNSGTHSRSRRNSTVSGIAATREANDSTPGRVPPRIPGTARAAHASSAGRGSMSTKVAPAAPAARTIHIAPLPVPPETRSSTSTTTA